MVPASEAEPMRFSGEQRAMIRDTFANGASESEFAVLLEVASARRLNPLLRQIHFVKRWDSQKKREVWSTQVSIDGLRAVAQRTGLYAGQDEPEYIEEGGRIVAAKVRVYRKDWTRASVGVAYWSEYVQTTRDGAPTRFWAQMPHVMISKCAEALALRKAFPEDMSGLYVPEEMAQADSVQEQDRTLYVEQAPAAPQRPTVDGGKLMANWFGRIDAAETAGAVNSVVSGVAKAHRDGVITDEQKDRVVSAVGKRRAAISAQTNVVAGDEPMFDGQTAADAGVERTREPGDRQPGED